MSKNGPKTKTRASKATWRQRTAIIFRNIAQAKSKHRQLLCAKPVKPKKP